MSIQVSFDISNIINEEFEVRWKVSKNSKWPVISNCQKWKGLLLKFTSLYKLQMKFCPTLKLKILLSPFQKVQEHPFLMCGWQVMIKSLSRYFELQTWITFTPIGQIMCGFLLQSPFNMLYHNPSLHFIKNHHIKSPFFKWTNLNFGGKKGHFEKYTWFSLQTNCNGLKTKIWICCKWNFTVPLVTFEKGHFGIFA